MAKAELLFVATTQGLVTLSNPGGIGRWLRAGHTLQTYALRAVWSNPHDPTHVMCSDGQQLWQSNDGAQTWHDMAGPACHALYASRTTPTRILAHAHHDVWLSHDAGVTWQHLGTAQSAGMAGEVVWYDQTISHDGGQSWQVYQPHILGMSSDGASYLVRQHALWYANDVAIATPPHTCLSWAVCSGRSWTAVGAGDDGVWHYHATWRQTPIPAHLVHASIYHPDHLWAASRHGDVWLSTDRGQLWSTIRQGLSPITALASARLI